MIRNMRSGTPNLMKSGSKHMRGRDKSTLLSLEACSKLGDIFKTSFGPNGLYKIVINHLDKITITSDCASIVKEVEVNHPAAKMVAMAAKMQEKEIGDGLTLVVIFASEMCRIAKELILEGAEINSVVKGLRMCMKRTPFVLKELKTDLKLDLTNVSHLQKLFLPILSTKSLSYAKHLSEELSKAIFPLLSKDRAAEFCVDLLRVTKAPAGSLADSRAVHGLVLQGSLEDTADSSALNNAKVVVFNGSVETQTTETKGVVLMENAEQLLSFNPGEEKKMEKTFSSLKRLGVGLVVTGGKFGDLAIHFMKKNGIFGLKIGSKFELQRVVRLVGCRSVPVFSGKVTQEDMGFCKSVRTTEIGGKKFTFMEQDSCDGRLSTVLVRGGTENGRDNAEKALDDGVNAVKTASREGDLVYGGGACEMELAKRLNSSLKDTSSHLCRSGIEVFTRALEIVPRVLAKSVGLDEHKAVSELASAHCGDEGRTRGVDVQTGELADMEKAGVFDLLAMKRNALRLATDVVSSLLRVDSIIMAKPAGGPKFGKNPDWDED